MMLDTLQAYFFFMNSDPVEKVLVQKADGEMNANILKGLLESAGIQAWASSGNEIISQASRKYVQGPNAQPWGIYVLKEDEQETKEILNNNN